MADVTDEHTQQLLRKIIREEVRPIVLEETSSMREEMASIRGETSSMRKEMASMSADITTIKQVVGQHSLQLREISSSLTSITTTLRAHSRLIRQSND